MLIVLSQTRFVVVGSAMVMFENHQSYDEAVSAKSAKLRSRDWMKTVSDMNDVSEPFCTIVHLSANLLDILRWNVCRTF